jgi:hypothetical protein
LEFVVELSGLKRLMTNKKLQILKTKNSKTGVCKKNFQTTNSKLRSDYGDNSYNNKEQLVEWR